MILCPCGFSVHGDSGVGCHALLQGDLPNPGIEPRSPTLQADSLQSEPPEKPKNTGVGSLSLLQGIFQTQESNWGLLHYRWILYQLSYQGSPNGTKLDGKYRHFFLLKNNELFWSKHALLLDSYILWGYAHFLKNSGQIIYCILQAMHLIKKHMLLVDEKRTLNTW